MKIYKVKLYEHDYDGEDIKEESYFKNHRDAELFFARLLVENGLIATEEGRAGKRKDSLYLELDTIEVTE